METRIKDRFNSEILSEIAQHYRIDPAALQPLDGFESFIFQFNRGREDFILRVSHDLRRTEAMIRGEVDWINYLADGGIGAASAWPSASGNLVESVDDGQGGHFLTTVFERAPGIPAWDFGWDDALYRSFGWTLGRMHKLTRAYRPTDPLAFRPQWDDPIMLLYPAWLPESEALARQKYAEIVAWCRRLPRDDVNYGLIHFDVHAGNFFVDGSGSLSLFDFDDCHYNWFANDIAIVLFYMVMNTEEPDAFALEFMRQFIAGYQLENGFQPAWLEMIPMFLKMREIDLYGIIHRSYDVENLEDDWDIRYMTGRKQRIEADVPYLDANFSSLLGLLKD